MVTFAKLCNTTPIVATLLTAIMATLCLDIEVVVIVLGSFCLWYIHASSGKSAKHTPSPSKMVTSSSTSTCSSELDTSGRTQGDISHTHMLKELGTSENWEATLRLYRDMQRLNITDLHIHSIAHSTFYKCGRWAEALEVLRNMEQAGHNPNKNMYNPTLLACISAGRVEESLELLAEMTEKNIEITYVATLMKSVNAEQISVATEIVAIMRRLEFPPNRRMKQAIKFAATKNPAWWALYNEIAAL